MARLSALETMQAILHDDPPPTSASPEVERIIRRCLESPQWPALAKLMNLPA
jgi:hypothetical protein